LLDANNYEVLSFDCYGTLVDWESGIISGLRPVLRAHRLELTDDEIPDLHTPTPSTSCKPPPRGAHTSSTAKC
jgi:hypothetical protein